MVKKVALVTGASRGIGRAASIQLAKDGFHVLVNFRSAQAEAEKTLALIESNGGLGTLCKFDISSQEEVETAIQEWQAANPDTYISVLINNAGIRKDNLMVFQSSDEWNEVLQTNLTGFFHVTRAVLKDMIFKKFGRIINIASLSGIKGMAGQVNYAASKGGLIAASKSLALEVARKNITVNTVAPGFIQTDMTSDINEEELKKLVPMLRFGEPEEVAAVIGFLAGPSASYITGEVISVNGGLYT